MDYSALSSAKNNRGCVGVSELINTVALVKLASISTAIVTLYSFLILMWRTRKTVELQRNPSSWHLKKDSVIHSIQWRAGSVRRKNLIIWRYGFWPWQRLVIYPDSVAEGEFRLLLKALYTL